MAQKTNLERAYDALSEKQARYNLLWRYYDGDHPLEYSHERLKDVFDKDNVRFSQNWCAVVTDSVLDRVWLKQLAVINDKPNTHRLNEIMSDTELELDADDTLKAAAVCGESFIIAEKGEDGEIDAYYNDPRLCHVFYRDDKPRQMSFAAKWWLDSNGVRNMMLYYADHMEHYAASKSGEVSSAKAFRPVLGEGEDWPENETGVIPVFHFRYDRRAIRSVFTNVVAPQSAFNKLFSDQMVAAEFGAFRQRWTISNADIEDLKNAPNLIWELPAGDGIGQQTQVGEFSETNLSNYSEAMELIAQNIARITRLPRHYFSANGGDPSGEALIAMEAPLNKQVSRFTANASVTWRKLGAYLLLLDGRDVKLSDVEAVFEKPETVQPRTMAEIREINSRAGVPLRTSMRWEGKQPAEIEQVEEEVVDAQAQTATLASAHLDVARRNASMQGAADAGLRVLAPGETPENVTSESGLNGAQIKSVLEVLDGVVTGRTPASVATELLVSVGLERWQAEKMVNDTNAYASKQAVLEAA